MRLFIAAPISDNIKKRLADMILPVKQKISQIKWVKADNFHFTLLFLGETSESLIDPVNDRLKQVAGLFKSFSVEIMDFSCFPSLKRPRVLFLSVMNGREILINLAESVRQKLNELGFVENKDFKPHLTVGRIKPYHKINLENIDFNCDPVLIKIDQIQLIQSTLKPEGPVYSIIERFIF